MELIKALKLDNVPGVFYLEMCREQIKYSIIRCHLSLKEYNIKTLWKS